MDIVTMIGAMLSTQVYLLKLFAKPASLLFRFGDAQQRENRASQAGGRHVLEQHECFGRGRLQLQTVVDRVGDGQRGDEGLFHVR